MDLDEFLKPYWFDLPEKLIAGTPALRRDLSRLLLVRRATGEISDHSFSDLPDSLSASSHIVLNNTRVSFRRLNVTNRNGKLLTPLFVEKSPDPLDEKEFIWNCLIFGAAKLKPGDTLIHNESRTKLTVIGRDNQFVVCKPDRALTEDFFEQFGEVPLPPYLKRAATISDRESYRTVFGTTPGSLAAPTAGLHFSPEIFEKLQSRGITKSEVTLTIGTGTFAPLTEWNLIHNRLHTETYSIPPTTLKHISNAKTLIAAGTTTLRALESNLRKHSEFRAGIYTTDLFIKPPDEIRAVAGLLTNFHLPGSSLFLLICAFIGTDLALKAYHHAIAAEYRFYSYGDAMLIL